MLVQLSPPRPLGRALDLFLWFGLSLALLFFGSLPAAHAEAQLPELKGHVNDLAGVLSQETAQRLEAELAQYAKDTGHQFAFLSIETLDGGALEDYSIRLAEKWKLGDKKRDDGLILLVVKADKKIRIEVGYGLEGAIPDATAAQIIRNELRPAFEANDFDGGITRAFALLMRAAEGEALALPGEEKQPAPALLRLLPLLIFALIFFAMARGGGGGGPMVYGGMGGLGAGLGGRRGGFGGGFGGGLGGGRGFGGGGGRFGGGGASGGW